MHKEKKVGKYVKKGGGGREGIRIINGKKVKIC